MAPTPPGGSRKIGTDTSSKVGAVVTWRCHVSDVTVARGKVPWITAAAGVAAWIWTRIFSSTAVTL